MGGKNGRVGRHDQECTPRKSLDVAAETENETRDTTLTSVDTSRFMVARQARLWLMTETAANQTAPNSNNRSCPEHINPPGRERMKRPRGGLVQQGTGQDADNDCDDEAVSRIRSE
jgi:hypothetical protein